jgi:glycerol-3-phosphate O-acyltransferase
MNGAPPAPRAAIVPDPYTAMTPRFGGLARAFARRFFGGFRFDPEDEARLRELEGSGAVVYVMRYASRLDYFLFNWMFLAAGIRLSAYANGIKFYYYRTLGQTLLTLVRGIGERLRRGYAGMREQGFSYTHRVVQGGGSMFLFLRTAKLGTGINPREAALESARSEIDYLREVVDTAFDGEQRVSLVPLALFWRKGAQPQARFLNVFYGGPERPSDTAKVLSFLWNYRNLAVRVGEPIDLRRFVDERRAAGRALVQKQVRRALLIFLRREEKPILGSALRPPERLAEAVLEDPGVRSEIVALAEAEGRPPARIVQRARKQLREIAARPSSSTLAALDLLVTWMFKRLFARIEVVGLDHIVEAAKQHPLVLVPNHRSHFDYLILSWLFYERHLVPPLVAAGINLSFWPLGPIFRRGGGFFLRRSFEGDRLYANVFRSYVQHLIKDGATQEFFLEGTRSRTGKTLQPRLGMLHMVLDAFGRGVRRDVLIVPVGFTYERLVEEQSITAERRGSEKKQENLLQLVRARTVLRSRFGAVTVRFGEPISLAALPDLAPPASEEPEARELRLRRATAVLGVEISRELNALVTAGRSSVAAAALLGGSGRGARESDLRSRIVGLDALLAHAGLARSENLTRCLAAGQPERVVELLVQSRLVERRESAGERLLFFPASARGALHYYRNQIVPALAPAAALALALLDRKTEKETVREASEWLELLRLEYFPPAEPERVRVLEGCLGHLAEQGWIERESGSAQPTREGRLWLPFVVDQIRPALEAYRGLFRAALVELGTGGRRTREALIKRASAALEDGLVLGEVRGEESICPTTLGNAVQLLAEDRVLACDGNPRLAHAELFAGPAFPALTALEARLGEALQDRSS